MIWFSSHEEKFEMRPGRKYAVSALKPWNRRSISDNMKRIALAFIRGYKFVLSPLLGRNCRFYPSCSDYMHEAIRKHGFGKGIQLGTRRLLKCHPFHEGGVDHVP